MVDYDCANDNSNNGRYIAPGQYWQSDFVSSGSFVTGGSLLVGANPDGNDHRVEVGIYTGPGLTGLLGSTVIDASGYSEKPFSFSAPIAITPGEQLYVAASGIGDFTAYDSSAGCFIGEIDGLR